MKGVGLLAAVVVVAAFYFTGRLDYTLYPLGLNWHKCARNRIGATFCGHDLAVYEERVSARQQEIRQAQ